MAWDYDKLSTDLAAAVEAAHKTHALSDRGPCNTDTAELKLPRAQESRVRDAAEVAGVSLILCGRGTWSLLWPRSCDSGPNRTVQAEAMVKVLQERGWDARVHRMID